MEMEMGKEMDDETVWRAVKVTVIHRGNQYPGSDRV